MAHPHNNPTCDKDSLERLKDSTHSKDKQLSSCSSNNAIVQHLAEKVESNGKTISKDSTDKSNSRKRKLSRSPRQIPEREVTCSHSSPSLRLHLSTHTGGKTFNCQICKTEFIRKQELSSHNWTHHLSPEDKERVKAGSCYFCAKPFQTHSKLQSHLLIHTQEKHFNCSTCKKQFTEKGQLTKHIFQHLSPEEQETEKAGWKHPCEFCGLRFKIQSTLYTHITVKHTKEKHYQCTICRKEFNKQGNLTKHLRIHSTDPAILKPFSCPQCQKSFTQKGHLKSHLFVHLPREKQEVEQEKRKASWKHSCAFCGARYPFESLLNLHIIGVHTNEKHFPCPKCKKQFKQQGNLTTHLRTHSEDPATRRPFSCSQCPKSFTEKRSLISHEKSVHLEIREFPCPHCHKCFSEKSKLSSHLFVHLPPEEQERQKSEWKHPCNFCGTRFKNESSLHWHITSVHTKEKHYQCTICRKEFNQQGNLTRHLRTHSSDPATRQPFSCSQCQKSFTSKGGLESHLFLHLPPEEQEIEKERRKESWNHSCGFCGARYPFESLLNIHIIGVHTNEKHFPCPKCKKEFKQQGHLTIHLRTHSEDPATRKPFNCSQCQKSFTSKGGLKSHLFVHLPREKQEIEKERRKESWKHSCAFCGSRYPNESLLNLHIIGVHTNEKHFPCPKCPKEFKQQGHLTTHLRTHSEDPATRKPFSCSQCQKSFTHKSHLTHHEKTVHQGIKQFPCSQCHKCFASKSQLNSHLFLHLPPEEQERQKSEWKHPCNFCGARFKIESSLHWHITSVHTKEKHYQCTICRKEFNQQGNLTRHLRTHSEDPRIEGVLMPTMLQTFLN